MIGPATLKPCRSHAEISGMTASTIVLQGWATRPLGKAVRIAIAATGMALAILVMLAAAIVENGSWALVVLATALAATSVRAAQRPTTNRLMVSLAVLAAIPLSLQIF